MTLLTRYFRYISDWRSIRILKMFLLANVISVSSVLAQENTDAKHSLDGKAPEIGTFDINNLSYSFEKTLPDLSTAFLDSSPEHRKDDIAVGDLSVNDNAHSIIIELAREIENGTHGQYDGMLISHEGKLVFESYYRKGRINLPHFQASVTKAYISLAIGRAIQLGYLSMADLHKPITDMVDDLVPEKLANGTENITLHKLMSMRSGIRINRDSLTSIIRNSTNLALDFLQQSAAISPETQIFNYQGIDPLIAWWVLDSVVPGSAEDFMKNEILAKIGITVYGWKDDVRGSNMTARDMLKLGSLVINNGKWKGQQLISAEYLTRATSKVTKPMEDWIPDAFSYGYCWYQTEASVDGKSYEAVFAWGGGGQFIVTVEKLDLMIVITGHDPEETIMTQVTETIIPAFVKDEFSPLEGPYMGQTPPGMVAEPFAPGIISKEGWELEGVFAPGMKEFYFTTRGDSSRATVIGFRQENNIWKKYIELRRRGETVFSPDGNRMHTAEGYRDRTGDGWSERKSLGPMFDREDWGIMRLSASAKGTYVFDDYKSGDVIRISKLKKNGKRQAPKELGPEINTGEWTAHPFIAPDESYLIWDSEREGGFGDSDLYISFRQKNGTWGPAINMGDKVNSDKWDAYASVTPDGKYILFNRGIDEENDNVDIYWVDARIIETLRPK